MNEADMDFIHRVVAAGWMYKQRARGQCLNQRCRSAFARPMLPSTRPQGLGRVVRPCWPNLDLADLQRLTKLESFTG